MLSDKLRIEFSGELGVTLEIGFGSPDHSRSITLTPEEARELCDTLSDVQEDSTPPTSLPQAVLDAARTLLEHKTAIIRNSPYVVFGRDSWTQATTYSIAHNRIAEDAYLLANHISETNL